MNRGAQIGRTSRGPRVSLLIALAIVSMASCPVSAAENLVEIRAEVQSYSEQLRSLLAARPDQLRPRGRTRLTQQFIDQQIATVESARDPAYQAWVMAQRAGLRRLESGSRFFHVPVVDFEGRSHDMTGEIPGVWHLERLDPAVFSIAERIRLQPENLRFPGESGIETALLLGGTAAQSKAHAYPGDFDYLEILRVDAASRMRAGTLVAEAIVEFVGRSLEQTDFEFTRLRIMPAGNRMDEAADYIWDAARVLDGSQRDELARQVTGLEGGRMNTDWRALAAEGRFFIIGKVIAIEARHQVTGIPFFRTEPRRANFQTAYFGSEVPPFHEQGTLGQFAQSMLGQVRGQWDHGHYLKAAKRSFNFCRTIGDLDCLDAVVPIFASPGAKAYHAHKVIEAIAEALHPDTPTRILTVGNARAQLENAAGVIETTLPVLPGTLPERPSSIASQLRLLTVDLKATETGHLVPNQELSDRLRLLDEFELVPAIELGLREQVESVIESYLP